jgi:hypothetical protein
MVAPSTQLPPILGLRMRNRSSRNSSRTPTRPDTGCCHNPILLADRVKAMLMQDKSNTYACDDKYSQRSISSTATAQGAAVDSVDTVCREKVRSIVVIITTRNKERKGKKRWVGRGKNLA